MIKKIDLLMPENSQYGVLHHFTRKLYEAFCRLNLECRLLEGSSIFSKTFEDPPELTIGFNGVPQHPSGIFLCELIERPHLCFLVDQSYRYFYLTEIPYIFMSCNDVSSCDLLKEKKFDRVFFLPPGVEKEMNFESSQDRPYEIVSLATFIDYERIRKKWPKIFPAYVCKVLDLAIERFFSSEPLSFMQSFQLSLNEELKKSSLSSEEKVDFWQVLNQLELYIRGKHRVDLIKALPDQEIHIFDSQLHAARWSKYLGKQNKLIFHPVVSFEESFDVLKKSRIVLNSSPHIANGAHERIFNALACGALPLTEENPYLKKQFKDGEEIVFFHHQELKLLHDKVHHYLNDENRRLEITEKGRLKVMEHHTWDRRAESILDHIKKLNMQEREC